MTWLQPQVFCSLTSNSSDTPFLYRSHIYVLDDLFKLQILKLTIL